MDGVETLKGFIQNQCDSTSEDCEARGQQLRKNADARLLILSDKAKPPVERWSESFDKARIKGIIDEAQKIKSIQERVFFVAQQLDGIPTRYGTLTSYDRISHGGSEEFLIDFTGLDCVTYVEVVLAMAKASSYGQFVNTLRQIRYAHGEVTWSARNHYFGADWTPNNNAVIENITATVGRGSQQRVQKTLNLIDRNADGVKEKQTATVTFIPKDRLNSVESGIKNGDVIIITASQNNLDVHHVGFAEWFNGKLYLRHAKKGSGIQRDQLPLVEYLSRNKIFSGVQVLRPHP